MNLPPVHPGKFLKEELDEMGLSANQFAQALSVPANRLTEIIAGRRAITADTALRIGRYFGGPAEYWMRLQARFDLLTAEAERGEEIARTVRPRAA
ncbi:MAG: HigA family addiction module antidote protein [Rhodospirillales bacterium]|nr:HigA family addiction module antidote protein [Rhodospirillales bacterium]